MHHKPHPIALVITELEVGGAERCLVNLACGLDRNLLAPAVFSLAPPPTGPRRALVEQLETASIPVRHLGYASKRQFPLAVRALHRELEQWSPAVIQSMLFHANVVTSRAIRRLTHHKRPLWYAGIRVADPSRIRQWVERKSLKTAQRVVCVSQRVADYSARRLGVAPNRLEVIPNGVDVQRIAESRPADLTPCGIAPRKRVITCVSRLTFQKGIDLLLIAADAFLEALPAHELLIVGDGPDRHELERRRLKHRWRDRIHFCGWRADIAGILQSSDLLVLPSRWEGMPNVLLEAMACRLPAVCAQAEGVKEILGPLADSQSAPVESPQILSKNIVTILQDDKLSTLLRTLNFHRVSQHYSLSLMQSRYQQLYESALGLTDEA